MKQAQSISPDSQLIEMFTDQLPDVHMYFNEILGSELQTQAA